MKDNQKTKEQLIQELAKRGHKIKTTPKYIAMPVMIYRDPDTEIIYAAGDPKAKRHAAALKTTPP